MSNGFLIPTEFVVEKWVIPYLHNLYMVFFQDNNINYKFKKPNTIVAGCLYVCLDLCPFKSAIS